MWLQDQCALEFLISPARVPIVKKLDEPQRCVRFSQRRMDLDRRQGGSLRLRVDLIRRQPSRKGARKSHQDVSVRHSRPGQSVLGIEVDGLTEVRDCRLGRCKRLLTPEITAAKI